jgi:hypothetical protein
MSDVPVKIKGEAVPPMRQLELTQQPTKWRR